MPRIPIRDLASTGLITDASALDLPINSFSMAVNVRFQDSCVQRGPIFRIGGADLANKPAHVFAYKVPTGSTKLMFLSSTGRVIDRTGVETDVSPASGWTPSESEAPVTTAEVNSVIYINRSDQEVKYRAKDAVGNFALLSSYNSGNGREQFISSNRFNALRSVGAFLVGVNTTESGSSYPTKVKWSNTTRFNMPPLDWAATLPESSAGENILADMTGALVDLKEIQGGNALLYGTRETFRMDYTGDNQVWNFVKQFDAGVINVNCVAEHDNVHYVFGENDIWKTDGQSKTSICDGRVRQHIFSNLVQSEAGKCFVFKNESMNEIHFCYVTSESDAAFTYGSPNFNKGCNRSACFNLSNETWSYRDLPYVTSAVTGIIPTPSSTIDGLQGTNDSLGGSIEAYGDSPRRLAIFASNPFTKGSLQPARLRTYEPSTSAIALGSIDAVATAPVLLRKDRIDLDEAKVPLLAVKYVSRIVVEALLSPDSEPLWFEVGTSDTSTSRMTWSDPVDFREDWSSLDFQESGRFLGIRIRYDDARQFMLSGFDLEVALWGE